MQGENDFKSSSPGQTDGETEVLVKPREEAGYPSG